MTIRKDIKPEGTIYELRIIKKALLRIKTSLSRERTITYL